MRAAFPPIAKNATREVLFATHNVTLTFSAFPSDRSDSSVRSVFEADSKSFPPAPIRSAFPSSCTPLTAGRPKQVLGGLYGIAKKAALLPVDSFVAGDSFMPVALSLEQKAGLGMHRIEGFGVQLARRQKVAAEIRAKSAGFSANTLLTDTRILRRDECRSSPRRVRSCFNSVNLADFKNQYISERIVPLHIAPELNNWRAAALITARLGQVSPSEENGATDEPKQKVAERKWSSAGAIPTCRLLQPHPWVVESVCLSEILVMSAGVRLVMLLARWWAQHDWSMGLFHFGLRRDGSPLVGRLSGLLTRIFSSEMSLLSISDQYLSQLSCVLNHLNIHQLSFLRNDLPINATKSAKDDLRNFAQRLDTLLAEGITKFVLKRQGSDNSVFSRASRRTSAPLPCFPWESYLGARFSAPTLRLARVSEVDGYEEFNLSGSPGWGAQYERGYELALPQPISTPGSITVPDETKFLRRGISRRQTRRLVSEGPGGILDAFTKVDRQALGRTLIENLGVLSSSSKTEMFFGLASLETLPMTAGLQTWWFLEIPKHKCSGVFLRFPAMLASLKRPPECFVYQARRASPTYWDIRELPLDASMSHFQNNSMSAFLQDTLKSSNVFLQRLKLCDASAIGSKQQKINHATLETPTLALPAAQPFQLGSPKGAELAGGPKTSIVSGLSFSNRGPMIRLPSSYERGAYKPLIHY